MIVRVIVALACLAVATFAPARANAHDYWLQADKFHLSAGESLLVHLNLGEDLTVQEEKAHQAERTERFELRLKDDVRDLAAATPDGHKPVFGETLSTEGAFLFTLVRSAAQVELPAAEFAQYLEHEGIHGVHGQRATERERYWRFLKLLGRVGPDNETDLHHRFTGAQFEIVLLQNPFTLTTGDEQIVQLLFETKPLADATVFALHREPEGSLTKLSATTDSRGVARFTLPQPGMWLIRSVYLRPCKGCKDVDWESFWTAYSFALE
jgi:uncharacterized GH25 family protein